MTTLPLATPKGLEPLLALAADGEHMRAIFQKRLAAGAPVEVAVTACTPQPLKSRKAMKEGRIRLSYELDTEWPGGRGRHLLIATLPVDGPASDGTKPGDLRPGDHPAIAPFRIADLYIDELQMAVQLFPFDPELPGLTRLTGPDGARVVEGLLPGGARVTAIEWDLRHYKPCNRAVVRVLAQLDGGGRRAVYVKAFADDRGEANYHDLQAVWDIARGSTALRVPEPLGYDPDMRLLAMAEVPGERELTHWIRCLEGGKPLPEGVGLDRVERAIEVAARAAAELHRSNLELPRTRRFAGEVADLAKDFDLMQTASPDLGQELAEVMGRLRAVRLDDEPLAPAHGGYRHKQMVGDEKNLTIIDWDGLTLANPALDAATFERRLLQEPVRERGKIQLMSHLAQVFRREFMTSGAPGVVARDIDLYLATSMTENMLRSVRRPKSPEKVAAECRATLDAVRRLLDGAAA